MPPPIARAARLRADLDRLGDEIADVGFSLGAPLQQERRQSRDALVRVLRSYLIPRLGHPEAPLLTVVAGPTGSGKSTVLNSLAGREISRPGPLRPTTREPVVWCHPRHADRYETIGTVLCRIVAEEHPLLDDITLVDTPDIDSYVAEHRRLTTEVLQHADVVVFLTSAQRYADAVPWEVLTEVDRRGSVIIYVLNRLGKRSSGAVSDYGALLRRHGLDPDPIHTIQEQRVQDQSGALPAKAVRKLSDRLKGMASHRDELLNSVTERGVAYAADAALEIAAAVEEQDQERGRLANVVAQAYDDAFKELTRELERGTLIRAEVVERWSERVGTGEVARWVRGSASWLRGLADKVTGQPAAVIEEVEQEARRELSEAVGTRLDRAARAVATGWALDEAGRDLLTGDLGITGSEARLDAEATIDEWLAGLTGMVEEEAPGRFRAARVASTGVNAAAVGTILALLASTGGLTGAEVGVAAGAAAAQQGVLEHILGRAAASSLAGSAKERLVDAIQAVFDQEAVRFHRILEAATDDVGMAVSIREAADTIQAESERFHAQ